MTDTIKPDSLFLGGATLEDAGYHSLSWKITASPAFSKSQGDKVPAVASATGATEPEPGLMQQMAVCLPFKCIYTHGDRGIIKKANTQVNEKTGPMIVQLETAPGCNGYLPQVLLIASVDREYNPGALDQLLRDCKKNNPGFKPYLLANEPVEEALIKDHNITVLEMTWENYLDFPGFQEYYRERLARLFKEYRRWPRVPGFSGREHDLADLSHAVDRFSYVHVDGMPGVGKSALLAKMADDKFSGQKKIIWVHAGSHFISKAEVIAGMALQLGLLRSPKVLEEENLDEYIPKLEKEVEEKLHSLEALVVFDGLDPFLNRGRRGFENKDLLELLSRWISPGRGLGKAKLVFTADLRVRDQETESFKQLKTSFNNAIKRKGQRLFLKPLGDAVRKELFLKWLKPGPGEQGFQGWANRLFKIGGVNLRLLRLLALWSNGTTDTANREAKIRLLEKTAGGHLESLVYQFLFDTMDAQKRVIVNTLEWIGKPVPRKVICSSAGMDRALAELITDGLVIANKLANTIELVFRFGKGAFRQKTEAGETAFKKVTGREIRTFRRLGDIARKDDLARAMDFYSAGNSILEVTGQWDVWADAPVVNPTGLLAKAEYLFRLAKQSKAAPADTQAFAERAVNLSNRCIDAFIEPGQGHFICAQAMEILYPQLKEDKIRRHYEQSIAIKPRADKYRCYAMFTYKRLKNYGDAEILFKKANQLEEKNKYLNVTGLQAQVEFYLQWGGHEKEAGDLINRISHAQKKVSF